LESEATFQDYYDEHGAETPLIEDLPPIQLDGEVRRTSVIVRLAAPQPGDSILDVGCGDGYLLSRLSARGISVSGVELAPARVRQAETRLAAAGIEADIRIGQAESLPFADGSFDLVVCSEVLEHLVDPAVAVGEIRRVLKPGGRLVITVPRNEDIPVQRCVHCGKLTPRDGHLHRFDAASLRSLLEGADLVVSECRGTYPTINRKKGPIGAALRLLPWGAWAALDRWAGLRLEKGNWLVALATRPSRTA